MSVGIATLEGVKVSGRWDMKGREGGHLTLGGHCAISTGSVYSACVIYGGHPAASGAAKLSSHSDPHSVNSLNPGVHSHFEKFLEGPLDITASISELFI